MLASLSLWSRRPREIPKNKNAELVIAALKARGIPCRYLDRSEILALRFDTRFIGHFMGRIIVFSVGGAEYVFDGATSRSFSPSKTPGRPIGEPPHSLLGQKDLVNAVLRKAGLRSPVGVTLQKDAIREAEQVFQTLRPSMPLGLCVKPVDGMWGKLVHTGLTTLEEFLIAFRRVARKRGRVLIQETVPGMVYRFFVLDGRCLAIRYATYPLVVGDGRSTIEELVTADQEIDPTLLARGRARRLLKSRGMGKDHVPAKGESIVLGNTTNIRQGAFPVDATDDVHPSYVALVERAVTLVPGLAIAGIDVAIEDATVPAGDNYHFIEVNESPGISAHHNPSRGKPRDVAGAIADYLLSQATPR